MTYARFDQADSPLNRQWEPLLSWLNTAMPPLECLVHEKTLVWQHEGISENETALFSAALMRRVLNNLVQNALRYAESRVEVLLSKVDDGYVLQVDDDGPGIPPAERERLFEAFTTGDDSRSKESGGFGLGLAIVKRIVAGHQGTIVIAEAALGGPRFVVRWPG